MKAKLFSVLALLVAVLFMGAIQPVEASADVDQNIAIEDVISFDETADLDIEQAFSNEAGPQYTAMEVCPVAQNFEGDIDHQLIINELQEYGLQERYDFLPHWPRSNLHYYA
ncbi:hypothetical protein [Fodinibius sp.]|uniref:hypothetical protein n=1 Tax=Fodinibius sp. TaxID=1872440 RepID=UPI002ACEBB8F|nr:hypothetical protein [Fodinibius sp.]MDZ7658078.1 hypothetical protein [Fodinibius sp.]